MNSSISLRIDPERCQSCKQCAAVKACRLKAIVQIDPGEQPYLDASHCRDCRVCVSVCPWEAVRSA